MSIDFEKLDKMMVDIIADIERVRADIKRTGDDPAFLAVEGMMRGFKPDLKSYIKFKGLVSDRRRA
tara:strand:- start:3197 stop:3394 length:198 start_codon:yes stop_codon:yes gene_type:complete